MERGPWLLQDWEVVSWSTSPSPRDVLTQLEAVLAAAGFTPDTARESRRGPGLAWTRFYHDESSSVQLHVVGEGEGHWTLHALQLSPHSWFDLHPLPPITTVLPPQPKQAPSLLALPLIRQLSKGDGIPGVWSTIVDTPSAAVEAWLRTRVFARLGPDAYGIPPSNTIVIDGIQHRVWAVMTPPRWVSLPSGNWWVIPTTAVVTRPEVAPVTYVPTRDKASLALRIAEYNGRTAIDAHTFFAVHPLLDQLMRCFREGDARILFPPLVEHDHRAEQLVWLAPALGFPWDKETEHLRTLSGAKRMVAELFLRGLTLKDVIRQLDGTVAESSVRRYFWEFHTDPKYAWLKPFLPAPDPVLSEAGRRAWQR